MPHELAERPLWLVWSHEHKSWWGPNQCGYFWNIGEAGRYTLEDALKICRARGVERNIWTTPPELVQPSPELLEILIGRNESPMMIPKGES